VELIFSVVVHNISFGGGHAKTCETEEGFLLQGLSELSAILKAFSWGLPRQDRITLSRPKSQPHSLSGQGSAFDWPIDENQ
jgi:hypothetical protein